MRAETRVDLRKKVVRHCRPIITQTGMRRQILLKLMHYQISSRATLDFVFAGARQTWRS